MRRLLLAILGTILASRVCAAQSPRRPFFGLGVGVNSNLEIRLPLGVSQTWRIEPSLRIVDDDITLTTITQGSPDDHRDVSQRIWRISVLLARLIPIDSTFTAYFGPRLAILRSSSTQQVDFGTGTLTDLSVSQVDKEAGLVTGAEAALGRHLSLGGEVGLSYTFRGDASLDRSALPVGSSIALAASGHTLSTSAAVVVRWFLGRAR
jgi:hypothetical protein